MKKSTRRALNTIFRTPHAVFLFAFLGFLDSTYLTILHYKHQIPSCSILKGCEQVVTSQFSVIYGVPIALFGSLFYLSIMILALFLITHPHKIYNKLLLMSASAGILVSFGLFLIQVLILKALCQFCIFTEIMAILIFTGSYLLFRKEFKKPQEPLL